MKRGRYLLNLIVFALTTLTIMLLGFSLWFARTYALTLVYPTRALPPTTLASYGIDDGEAVSFTTEDDLTLVGWYVAPAPDSDGAFMIAVHGVGGNRTALVDEAMLLIEHGYGVLLFDLRNHGSSPDAQTTFGYLEARDLSAALDYVQTRPEVNAERIGVIGVSMGGAVALRTAAERTDIRAVIVQSTYATFADAVGERVAGEVGALTHLFTPLILGFAAQETNVDWYDVRSVDIIAQIAPRPILIMHGELDPLIGVHHGQRLFAAAGEPKTLFLMPQGQHGGLFNTDPDGVTAQIIPFLEAALRGSG